MSNFDYSKEAHKLIEFTQRCLEIVPENNESFKRMKVELKNRKDFRKTLRSLDLLETGRHDLIDNHIFKEHVTEYPMITRAFAKVDPNSCKVEYKPPKLGSQGKKNYKDRRADAKRGHSAAKKRQKLMEGAENNANLVKTLLGSPYYIDSMKSPSPPPPPLLPTMDPPPNPYDSQTQMNLIDRPSLFYHNYPISSSDLAPTHAYAAPIYQQPFLMPQYSIPTPGPHMTSTLPPIDEVRHDKVSNQVSKPVKPSRNPTKQKMPKSLRKMGKVAKRYDLDT